MKRGYMDWKKEILPDQELKKRRTEIFAAAGKGEIDALIVYGDVANADEMQFLTNLWPYWTNDGILIFKDGSIQLVSSHSARVNPWIIHLTGIPEKAIFPAGPGVSQKTPEVLKRCLGRVGRAGLIGKYFPQAMIDALEADGFEYIWCQKSIEQKLAEKNDASCSIVKEGIEKIIPVAGNLIKDIEQKKLPQRRVLADIEYVCRKAGAMDTLLLCTGSHSSFGGPSDLVIDDPWTVYIQIQYLGEWFAWTWKINGEINPLLQEAEKEAAGKLLPGKTAGKFSAGIYQCLVYPKLLSDSIAIGDSGPVLLGEGQIISLAIWNEETGEYLQNMYEVAPGGAKKISA